MTFFDFRYRSGQISLLPCQDDIDEAYALNEMYDMGFEAGRHYQALDDLEECQSHHSLYWDD